MTRVVAVSGGVDSVVLLHMLAQQNPHEKLIVAHFDHGIRDDSFKDAQFVEQLAKNYGYEFIVKREELGGGASEELARQRRYEFLFSVSKENNAPLVTAHHLDDLVETIAINVTRGTGWRGLTPFSAAIERPLIHLTKTEVLTYADNAHLQWREDPTNAQDIYLRNRLRQKTKQLTNGIKRELHALHAHQKQLRSEIRQEVATVIGEGPEYDRYLITNVTEPVAIECLRYVTKGKLTRPQLARLLHAVKTAKPGAVYQAGNGISVRFSTRYFTV